MPAPVKTNILRHRYESFSFAASPLPWIHRAKVRKAMLLSSSSSSSSSALLATCCCSCSLVLSFSVVFNPMPWSCSVISSTPSCSVVVVVVVVVVMVDAMVVGMLSSPLNVINFEGFVEKFCLLLIFTGLEINCVPSFNLLCREPPILYKN